VVGGQFSAADYLLLPLPLWDFETNETS